MAIISATSIASAAASFTVSGFRAFTLSFGAFGADEVPASSQRYRCPLAIRPGLTIPTARVECQSPARVTI